MTKLERARTFFSQRTLPGLRVLSLSLVAASAYAIGVLPPPPTLNSVQSCTGAGTTFDVSGSFAGGASLNGTLDIDTGDGCILGGDLDVVFAVDPEFNVLSGDGYSSSTPPDSYEANFTNSNSGQYLFLAIDLTGNGNTLVGYDGGALCSTSDVCGTDYGTVVDDPDPLSSGNITPAVPEPSSFVLLLTAPVMMAARRFRKIKQ